MCIDTKVFNLRLDAPVAIWAKSVGMKQRYHTIIKPEPNGWFVGWVEEVPGAITQGRSLAECRENLRDALRLMLETHRDEARIGLDEHCIQEAVEIDVAEPHSFQAVR
jgi:predicted RNase H-like HicB family nuclease